MLQGPIHNHVLYKVYMVFFNSSFSDNFCRKTKNHTNKQQIFFKKSKYPFKSNGYYKVTSQLSINKKRAKIKTSKTCMCMYKEMGRRQHTVQVHLYS